MRLMLGSLLFVCAIMQADIEVHFARKKEPFTQEQIVTDPLALLKEARHMLAYIEKYETSAYDRVHVGLLGVHGFTLQQVKDTLASLVDIIETDFKQRRPQRILDPHFLSAQFDCIAWAGDARSAAQHKKHLPENKLYLTQYFVPCVYGSMHKTRHFNCALYAVPADERGKTLHEIEQCKEAMIRFKYTKPQILAGILEKNKLVQPLAWLSRHDFEHIMMQGTGLVQFDDGAVKGYSACSDNGRAYDRKKDKYDQERFFYFKEISKIAGLSGTLTPHVAFAGDIKHIGLGKIIAIRYANRQTKQPEIRLGILADTGGAFQKNLYQLDLFTGVFKSDAEFKKHIQPLPHAVDAFILFKKPTGTSV